jgi:hypothetical protein
MMSGLRCFHSGLAILLSAILVQSPLCVPAATAQEAQGGLRITIVDGDEAILNVRQRVSREAIIQVEDENRRPVAGALVTLTAPRDGASAVFSNGLNNITLTTDESGRVVVRGIRPNSAQGKYAIRVLAVKEGLRGTAQIQMSNIAAAAVAGGISGKVLAFLLIAGAGAAAGTVAATRNGNGGAAAGTAVASPIRINPGTPTVGPPR